MLTGSAMIVLASVVLVVGAELFVEHAVAAGRHLGVTGFAMGLLLAGAEPEELITSVIAAVRDRGGIAAGDAIGANVTMLTLVLGLGAVLGPVPVSRKVRRTLIGVSALGAVAALVSVSGIGRIEGLGLVALAGISVTTIWLIERTPPPIGELAEMQERDESDSTEHSRLDVLAVFGGIAVMGIGGWIAVLGAEGLVGALGVADSIVGLSIVALATTAELFALVVSAQRRRVSELAVAGVAGSAGYNATVTLGGAALARPIAVAGVTAAAWLAAVLPLLLLGLGRRAGRVTRSGGAVLVMIYVAYLVILYT